MRFFPVFLALVEHNVDGLFNGECSRFVILSLISGKSGISSFFIVFSIPPQLDLSKKWTQLTSNKRVVSKGISNISQWLSLAI